MNANQSYDVLICGGGLAGLTLALQLGREATTAGKQAPRIAIIERTARPLTSAAFKVGESTVEAGAHYLYHTLGLRENLLERQLVKNGLRCYPGGGVPFARRTEIGSPGYPRLPAFQLDRGRLETDLRALCEAAGVQLFENAVVHTIQFNSGPAPDARHTLVYRDAGGTEHTLHARWVVDALGRRRFLQRQLKLQVPISHRAGAAWFRVGTRVDIRDCGNQAAWLSRDPDRLRYYSTNHLMGAGYWVWLIPLPGDCTSIGIVFDPDYHQVRDLNTYDRARAWLTRHEPELSVLVAAQPALDFQVLGNVGYGSRQLFSAQGWCCTGEAGVFFDPLYGYGTDFIALENSLISRMIALDRAGALDPRFVAEADALVLTLAGAVANAFSGSYGSFGRATALLARLYWDTIFYWSCFAPILLYKLYGEPDVITTPDFRRFLELHAHMQTVLRRWGENPGPGPTLPEYVPFPPRGSYLSELHLELEHDRTPDEARRFVGERLRYAEEAAAALTLRMLDECQPVEAARARAAGRVRIYAHEAADAWYPVTRTSLLRAEPELRYLFGEMDARHFQNVKMLWQCSPFAEELTA